MIAPKDKPVICEELTWKDVDKPTNTMKMAISFTAACEQPSPHLPVAVDIMDCSEIAKRISQLTGVPPTIEKIVELIATKLVKFIIVIIFVQKKAGEGEKTI